MLDVVEAINLSVPSFDFLGFAADLYYDQAEIEARNARYLGGVEAVFAEFDAKYVIGIGDGAARGKIDALAKAAGRHAALLVHPDSTIGASVDLGPGTVITAGSRLTSHISVGRHVHVNLNATVSHDVVIEDYVTLSPGVNVSGRVHLGEGVTMGTGSRVIERLTIGAGTMVGAGATVVTDLPSGVTAVGTPARSLSKAQ